MTSKRKSKSQRLCELAALESLWSKSPFSGNREHRFMLDMIIRLQQDRGLTTGQRRWIDHLVEAGVPTINEDLQSRVDEITKALNTLKEINTGDWNWEINVLSDFRSRVAKNYSLTGKQISLLERVLGEANEIVSGNSWKPSEANVEALKVAVKLYDGYSNFWKADRPAVHRAVEAFRDFVAGVTPHFRRKHSEKILWAVRGRMKKYESPRFSSGSLGKYRGAPITCMTDVYISDRGDIVNDWLLPDGTIGTFNQDDVKKR